MNTYDAAAAERDKRGWNDLTPAADLLRRVDAMLLVPITAPTTRKLLTDVRPYIEKAVSDD